MSGKVEVSVTEIFVKEIISHDLRTISGLKGVEKIFRNGVDVLLTNECVSVLFEYHNLRRSLEAIIEKVDSFFKNANVDESLKINFFKVLFSVKSLPSFYCSDLPKCNCSAGSSSHEKICEEISFARSSIILKKMLRDDLFEEEINYNLKCLSGLSRLWLGDCFLECDNNLFEFYNCFSKLYQGLANSIKYKRYHSFNDDQKINFHRFMLQLLSRTEISSVEEIAEMHLYLTNNIDSLGLCYYVMLISKLNTIAYNGLEEFYKEIKSIASDEKVWICSPKQ